MSSNETILEQVEAILDSDSGTDSRRLVKLALMMIKQQTADLTAIKDRLTKIETLLKIEEVKREGLVDWAWVRDKLMQPAVVALLMWILLTFIPNALRGTP